MKRLLFSEVSAREVKSIAHIVEYGIADYPWTRVDDITLSSEEQQEINAIARRLRNHEITLMNEATIWARGIYPLLMLAEQRDIQAWAQVPLEARYPHVTLQGLVGGVLGRTVAGQIEAPYFLVLEAKRSLESQNPRYQLYGQILAAAWLNWEQDQQPVQEIFGCYTISDIWTLLRAEVEGFESETPTLRLETSREYVQRAEMETLLKILKAIVQRHEGDNGDTHM
jgi:hypothetical protein